MMRRRDHLFGRWIRRSSGYPTWFGRLARVGTRARRAADQRGVPHRRQRAPAAAAPGSLPLQQGLQRVGRQARPLLHDGSRAEAAAAWAAGTDRRGLLSADPAPSPQGAEVAGLCGCRGRPLLMFLGSVSSCAAASSKGERGSRSACCAPGTSS